MKIHKSLYDKSIYLVLFLIVLSIWVSPTRSAVFCSGAECRSSTGYNGNILKGNLVQTFDIRIQISSDLPEYLASGFSDKDKGIGLFWSQEKQLLITVPMRYGSSTAFAYATPKGSEFKEIRVRIVESESLFVFIDEKIAYSHRYENSPFFVNYLFPVDTPETAGNVTFTAQIVEQVLYNKDNPLQRSGSILLILVFVIFATVKVLKKMFPDVQGSIEIEGTFHKSLFGLVGMSWGLTILAWIRNPIDSTGAVNPGPFGPIGAAFSDFYQLSQVSQFDRPYDMGGTNYPPSGILLLRSLSFYDPNNLSFFPIAGIILGAVYFFLVGSLKEKLSGIIFLGSFPIVFGVVRGNLDVLAVFLVWTSIVCWKKQKHVLTVSFMAFAIMIKIWPIVFLLIFLKKKNWLLVLYTVLLGLSMTLFASFMLGYRSINEIINITLSALLDQTTLGTYAFQNTFSVSSLLFFGHLALMSKNPFNDSQTKVDDALAFVNGTTSSMIIVLLFISLLYFFFRARHLSNEFLILSGIVLLIPTQSFTYRASILLLYFYLRNKEIQVVATRPSNKSLIDNSDEPFRSSFLDKIVILCTVPLLAPTAFYFVPGTQFSTASVSQPLGLIVVIGLAIYGEHKNAKKI